MNLVSFQADYEVKDNTGNVLLDVTIGFAQPASTMIYVNSNLVAGPTNGSFTGKAIGKNNALKGQKVSVITIVHDLLSTTNRTSVKHKVSGGQRQFSKTSQFTVAQEGDLVLYRATFNMV